MSGHNKNISPREKERAKTEKERAEDISYTLNHTIVCTATDFIDPYLGNHIQKILGNKSQLANCWKAEIIGDFGSIPVTIATQRLFPGTMAKISKIAEPMFSKAFHNGAQRDAKAWAKKKGYSEDSKEYKERVEQIYNYEVAHIPQALVWTGSSVVLNVASQNLMGNKAPISHIAAGKIGGALLTGALTVGARAIFPRKAEKFDHFTSEKFLLPIEGKIERALGIEDEDHLHKSSKHKLLTSDDKWKKRVETDKVDKPASLNI